MNEKHTEERNVTKELINARKLSWLEIVIGAPAMILFIFFLFVELDAYLHPGQNWGLMIIVPLTVVMAPFALLLIGGIGLLKQRPWGLQVNGFVFPIFSLIILFSIVAGRLINDFNPIFYNSRNFLVSLLFEISSLSQFPYFYLFVIFWALLIGAIRYFGYHNARQIIK